MGLNFKIVEFTFTIHSHLKEQYPGFTMILRGSKTHLDLI